MVAEEVFVEEVEKVVAEEVIVEELEKVVEEVPVVGMVPVDGEGLEKSVIVGGEGDLGKTAEVSEYCTSNLGASYYVGDEGEDDPNASVGD